MSERDEAGLRRLQHDLDEADWPSPELLARYATDPNGLSDAEKQQVERALAASRIVADELATLRGFDFSRLDADRRGADAIAGSRVGVRSLELERGGVTGWIDRLRASFLLRPRALAGLAALLALAVAYALSGRPGAPPGSSDAPPQLAERAAPRPPVIPESSAIPSAPQTAPETGTASDPDAPRAHPETDTSRIAALPPTDRAPDRLPPRSGDAPPEARSGPGSDASPTLATNPTPSPSPNAKPNPMPTPTPTPTPATGIDDDGEREVLLAMAMPDYRPAYGLEPRPGSEWIVRGGEAEAANAIVILAPDHLARACGSRPRLHWSLERVPPRGTFYLTIADAEDEPVVLDRAIPMPARAGLQRLDLAALAIALPEGRPLRWSIALREDETAAPAAFDFGWLRVEPPDAAASARLAAADEAGLAALYAELGCYSEALDAALGARAKHPGDPAPERAIARLAAQAGFDPARAKE